MPDSQSAQEATQRLDAAIFDQISSVIGDSEESATDQPDEKGQADEETETSEDATDGEEAEDSEDDNPDGDERSELGDGEDSELEQAEAGAGDESESVSESVKIEVDGEEYTTESIRGLRDKAKDLQSGLTQKYQHVAEQRKEVEQRNEQAGQILTYLENQLKAPLDQFMQVNWQELQANNPAQYQQLHAQYRNAQLGYNQVNQAMRAFQDKAKQDAEADFKRKAAEARTTLEEMHPDWNNDLYQDTMKYAIEQGVPEEDIQNEIRPWVLSLALKAMRSDKGKIQAVPKPKSVKKTLKQRASSPANPKEVKMKQAKREAQKGNQKAKDFLFNDFLEQAGVFEE